MSVAVSVSLASLCTGLIDVPKGLNVSDVTLDSRRVQSGGLFLACAGRRTHGLTALEEALKRGARAILWEPVEGVAAPTVPTEVFCAPLAKLSQHASTIAARFFGDPSASMAIAGITGTNGKTTSAWLLAQTCEALGQPAAYLGTLGIGRIGSGLTPSDYTTSDAVSVQRQLAALRDGGAQAVAMEVSSHALDQQRVAAVRFRGAAFTNLTRDHLDYHGTMEAYGAAKARLFDMPALDGRVFNVDDAFGAELAQRHAGSTGLVLTARSRSGFAVMSALRERGVTFESITAIEWRGTSGGLACRIDWRGERALTVPLIGEFNVDNVLTVLGLLAVLGVAPERGLAALSAVNAPPGRMEAVAASGRALAIVDYAHTPDALAKALRAARAHCSGRLHVVFGCGGDRDRGKRPQMAAVAAAMADEIMITDDNPRTEPPAGIVADITGGMPAGTRFAVVHDRATAIRTVLAAARADDAVLIAGKGHEDYQIVGEERRAFSDRQLVRSIYAEAAA